MRIEKIVGKASQTGLTETDGKAGAVPQTKLPKGVILWLRGGAKSGYLLMAALQH